MHRFLGLALALAALLPSPARAQIQQPAPGYCLSAAADFCVQFVQNDLQLDYGGTQCASNGTCYDGYFARQSIEFLLFGDAVKGYTDVFGASFQIYDGNAERPSFQGDGQGTYRYVNGTGFSVAEGTDLSGVTESNVLFIIGAGVRCDVGSTCFEVSEPGTYLLMFTGIMGLGFVGWRRRETLA